MTPKQKARVWLKFSDEQGGAIPVSLAAELLNITPQGVHSAIGHRKLQTVKWCGLNYVGLKSVQDYRWRQSRKFRDNGHV